MEYKKYSFSDKEEVNSLLLNGSNENIISALLGAVNGITDFDWVQELCLRYVNHDDFWVAKTAINSLGNLARVHSKISLDRVYKELENIDKIELKSTVSDVLDDIMIFVRKEES